MRTKFVLASIVAVLACSAGHLSAQQPADAPALYARQCAPCHGAAGVPNAAMARSMGIPDLTDARGMATRPDSVLEASVAGGKGKMQGYRARLSAEQIHALVAYVKTLRRPAAH